MNRPPRIVPAAILFFDSSRLLFLLTLFAAYMSPQEMIRGSFPYIMCVAPNALFLLMSLFLFIRPEVSRAYIPLYITGKSLSLFCMILWLLIARGAGTDRVSWAIFFGLADLGTIMGMAVLRTEEITTTETSAETLAETLPETIIKEGGE